MFRLMLRLRIPVIFGLATMPLLGQQGPEFFETKIRPVLAENCYACHGAKMHIAGLDLSTAASFAKGGERGSLVDHASPDKSLLLTAVSYLGDFKMPPKGKLKPEQIENLSAWVKGGAAWPGGSVAPQPTQTVAKYRFTKEQREFWAFQPIRDPALPAVTNTAWVKSPIDRFILSELEKKALAPAPPADKPTLLRRVTYDLTGMPPTREEIAEFLADKSPNAFAKVVDRLLASPRYGERWGRHWLDVARYADSAGDDDDNLYPYAYKYRDWVIDAFNKDMPFDRMVRLQIAGDLLPADKPGEVNTEGIIATGFIALGQKPLTEQNKPQMLYDIADEQLDTTGRALMGLTLGCARCHDHKFDPIPTADYYSMASMFHATRTLDIVDKLVSTVLMVPLAPKDVTSRYREHEDRIKSKTLQMDAVVGKAGEARADGLIAQAAAYMVAAARNEKPAGLDSDLIDRWAKYLTPGNEVRPHLIKWNEAVAGGKADVIEASAKEYQHALETRAASWWKTMAEWRESVRASAEKGTLPPEAPKFEGGEDRFFFETTLEKGPFALPDKNPEKVLNADVQAKVAAFQVDVDALKKASPPELPLSCGVEEGIPGEARILIRGNVASKGAVVPRQFLQIIAGENQTPVKNGSGRLEMAEWLTSANHPLTARVIANRIWQNHFGEGIVRTPNNYGRTGEPPTHPELLDYLARQFMQSGWSFKTMHRLLLLSSTYQMSSQTSNEAHEIDAPNRLFSRANRRRLDFEEIRDSLLFYSGELDMTMGGVPDPGKGVDWRKAGAYISANKEPQISVRRSVYLPLRRSRMPSLLTLLDFGDATTPGEGRARTNTAPQALFMMNSEYVGERARLLGESLKRESSDNARVTAAYLSITGRDADRTQINTALEYIAGLQSKTGDTAAAWQSFCRALLVSNAFLYVD
jgi:mono/diheme cytochrome c family protein